ncbi:hypothetical protein ACXYMT_13145 [Salinimicrobium sp. CAU 1759]
MGLGWICKEVNFNNINMIESLQENLFSASVIAAITILFLPFFLKKNFEKGHIASLTITIGIFGTFFGVFIGLMNFNSEDITGSVPVLIDGLKTAFITSIAGLLANIIIRTFPQFYGFPKEEEDHSDDLARQMIRSMDRMTNSISGEEDGSLLTQLQKIRTTNIDGFDKMNKSFEDFAEQMVADNTQSLIDALTQVMKDFNTKINEQFGENFKRLNEGVGAMLEWQKEYKTQVQMLNETFLKISTTMEGVDKNLENVARNHNVIHESNETYQKLLNDLSLQVSSFAELGEKAKTSFPIIEQNMEKLTSVAKDYIGNALEDIESNYESFSKSQTKIMESYKEKIDEMIVGNADRIQKLDEELGQELNKALESLGTQLTSLSQHFVEDYKPLTEKLRSVVQMSKDLN